MTEYLYRVEIIEQPEWEERLCFDTFKYGPNEGERYRTYEPCPVGWEPHEDYIARFGTDKWITPALDKTWRSRSSAALRRDLLEDAGFKAIIQRSAPVVWPAEGEERVRETTEIEDISAAIQVLKGAGLIESADQLFR